MLNNKILKVTCALLIIFFSVYLGYSIGTADKNQDRTAKTEPALKLNIIENTSSQDTISTLINQNIDSAFTTVALYYGVQQAYINIENETYTLADALKLNKITQEEIAYLARLDERNGICTVIHETKNGLTHFTYQYPNFNLRIIYDVYVTPDGSEDLINHIYIYPSETNYYFGAYTDFYDENGRTDWEDWGVSFEVLEASSSRVSISCTQYGGQQIGQLSVDWYDVIKEDGGIPKQKNPSAESPKTSNSLTMNGQTTFTIDWSDIYEPLPSGNYWIILNVVDHFDESQVHPLMQDYHVWQIYDIFFTIE